jgi:hypothetical protein
MIQHDLPGAEILKAGLADLQANRYSPEALAICALRGRLQNSGVDVPKADLLRDAEILMYEELGRIGESNPHAAMTGILRRLDAYASNDEARRHRAAKDKVRNMQIP